MKLHELVLQESSITIPEVRVLSDLMDENDKFFTGTVNVTGDVFLSTSGIEKIPVKFGKVGGFFTCQSNKLTSLEGAPREVGSQFVCDLNPLTTLEHAPEIVGYNFYAEDLRQLKTLKGIHKITKKVDGLFRISGSPIEIGGIGLLLIEGIIGIRSDIPAFDIINKYLGQGKKGLLLCQEELIEKGYEAYAEL